MEPYFTLDPFTSRLAKGDTGRQDTWGLNVNLASPPPPELRAPYGALAARLASIADAAGMYVYPFEYLHITCSSPAPFTHCRVETAEEREVLAKAWGVALREWCVPERGFPAAPFPLVYAHVSLERAAAIFRVEDPTGSVAAIRRCIQAAWDEHPALLGLPGGLRERSAHRVPGIVHTTFLRFGSPPAPGVTEAAVRAAFEAAAAGWEPVTITCDALRLVEEAAIYMHLQLRAEDAARILSEYPFVSPRADTGSSNSDDCRHA